MRGHLPYNSSSLLYEGAGGGGAYDVKAIIECLNKNKNKHTSMKHSLYITLVVNYGQ